MNILDASAAEIEHDIEQKKKILNRKVRKTCTANGCGSSSDFEE